jgi:hypothetical protein
MRDTDTRSGAQRAVQGMDPDARVLPCGVEGRSEAAHTGSDGGMSMKASDRSCVPLCADCHTQRADSYHRIA